MTRRPLLKAVAPILAFAVLAGACGDDDGDGDTAQSGTNTTVASPAMDASTVGTDTGAATLRAELTGLLTEHVYLASLATGAALRGDQAEFEAFAAALNGPSDSNTADLTAAVTGAYGEEVGRAFDGLWRAEGHIPAVVAYTQAIAAGDQAAADRAVDELLAYAETFGTTLRSVNPSLEAGAVAEAVVGHITSLKAVIDAQHAGEPSAVFAALREAYHHMSATAEVLAVATAQQFPDRFDGDAASTAAGLRAGLTSLLREHVLLAATATGAALDGRTAEFEAAAAALNGPSSSNTADLVDAVRGVYGDEVGRAFDGLWRAEGHIPAVVAYTQAIAAGDQAGADRAVEELVAYAETFGTTLASVNPNLDAGAVAVADAVVGHATTLKAVIDAQRAGDAVQAASLLREAVHHMNGTAAVLASATARQFPEL